MKPRYFWALTMLLLAPTMAAHPQHSHGGAVNSGALAGLTHPIFGLDHLLAMVAVGLLAAQLGGAAIWALPVTFVSAMAIGGVAGMIGMPLPLAELTIIASLAVFGVALVSAKKIPLPISIVVVAFFALFHGHAHGTELPALAQPTAYAAGFLLSTALLHAVGVLAGRIALRNLHAAWALRLAGGAIAIAAPVLFILT